MVYLKLVLLLSCFVINNVVAMQGEQQAPTSPTSPAKRQDGVVVLKPFRVQLPDKTLGFGFDVGRDMIINGFNLQDMVHMYQEIFINKVYDFKTTSKKPLIIDCGSNIGLSVLGFKYRYPEAEVYAFEPDKDTFALLEHNVTSNYLQDVHLFNVALDEKKGEMTFYYNKAKRGDTRMSVAIDKLPDVMTVQVEKLSEMLMTTLKDCQVDMLKMDVEGSEHGILHDLVRNNLMHQIKEMSIEYHHHMGSDKSDRLADFLKILENNGFGYQFASWDYDRFNDCGQSQCIMLHAYRKEAIEQ